PKFSGAPIQISPSPHRASEMDSKDGEYMVEVEDLHKGFDGNQVLDGVTCQIPAGKISVVMGPSGTGKSVLLRHVVGLLYPRKRAGFARALVLEPELLLFDEPDSGLDPVRTALLCDLIKQIQRKYNSTGVVISHDIKSCFNIGDHIILLHGGKVVDQGSKEEL